MKKGLLLLLLLTASVAVMPVANATETKVAENLVNYRIHLGMGIGEHAVTAEQIQAFIDDEITPLFPSGMTVFTARGQWQSPEALQRESTTVVDLQEPETKEAADNVSAVARLYVERFKTAKASAFVQVIRGVSTTLYY